MERTRTHLDTHVLIWLYAGDVAKLSKKAKSCIDQSDLWISPIVLLELEYLHIKKVITVPPSDLVQIMRSQIGLQISSAKFAQVVTQSLSLEWTRDPFDRLIVGNAISDHALLLTKDRAILQNYSEATW